MTDAKYDLAIEAIKNLFSDVSVAKETTIQNLNGLKDEIDLLIDSLNN